MSSNRWDNHNVHDIVNDLKEFIDHFHTSTDDNRNDLEDFKTLLGNKWVRINDTLIIYKDEADLQKKVNDYIRNFELNVKVKVLDNTEISEETNLGRSRRINNQKIKRKQKNKLPKWAR